jgi:hypothetical protein
MKLIDMKLTQKIVREYLGMIDCKLRRNVEYNEYVLVHGTGDAETTYFSTDLDDIIGTARVMHGSHPSIEQAEEYLASVATVASVKFKDLSIGETFEFNHTNLSCLSTCHGPWVKTSARRYSHVDLTSYPHLKNVLVGTIKTTVLRGLTCGNR